MDAMNQAGNRSCLVGHTGFVGSALARQTRFDACFNSANIKDIRGQSFGNLVCAAAPGSMLAANKAPEWDRDQIHGLIDRLSKAHADRFILISSIAVLDNFAGGDDETTENFQSELAYGRHRRELEVFVEDHFETSLIVRLPALFGRGLRKNFIFDLLNPVPSMLTTERHGALRGALDSGLADWVLDLYRPDPTTGMLLLDREELNRDSRRAELERAMSDLGFTAIQFHHPETTYQFYAIDRLWRDVGIALHGGLSHLHLTSEPIKAKAIHRHLTGEDMPETPARLHRENMHTAHGRLWDASGPYIYSAWETLDRLSTFFNEERALA